MNCIWIWKQEKVVKDHVNMQFRQPYEQADYNFYHLIQHKIWHMNEYLEVLPFLEADALTSFFPRILSRVHVEGYAAGEATFRNSFIQYIVHCSRCSIGGSHCQVWLIYFAGNITANEAEALLKHVEVALSEGPIAKAKPLFASQQRERRIVRLAPGYDYYYPTVCLNPDDENSALINYLQVCQQPPLDSKSPCR